MKKDEKSATVAQLAENFGRASIALISEYKGLSAGESDDMRRRIRAVSGEFRVAKNTLLRRAIKDTSFAPLDSQLGGPVGLILSYADPVELAKTVSSFKDLGEKFKVRGGVLDGKPLTPEEIDELASLPPREVISVATAGAVAGSGNSIGAAAERAGHDGRAAGRCYRAQARSGGAGCRGARCGGPCRSIGGGRESDGGAAILSQSPR